MSKLAGWSWEQEALARCEGILVIDVAGCGWMWLTMGTVAGCGLRFRLFCYFFFN